MSRQRSFNRTSSINAILQCAVSHSEIPRPCGNTLRVSVECYQGVRSSVFSLLSASCPTDISGLVISILIRKSVNRMLWRRTLSNIIQKRFKRSPPLFANCNSSTSPIFPLRQMWVSTSLNDIRPRLIFWGDSLPVRVPMRASALIASAACRFSSEQIGRACIRFVSAIANTFPNWKSGNSIAPSVRIRSFGKHSNKLHNDNKSEATPREIDKPLVCRKWYGYDFIRHDVSFHDGTLCKCGSSV